MLNMLFKLYQIYDYVINWNYLSLNYEITLFLDLVN